MKEEISVASEAEVLFEELPGRGGNLGLITLNRPKALNALTLTMCQTIDQHLERWAMSPRIKAVVIQGKGDKAFCAGGDVMALYKQGTLKNYQACRDFFHQEYRLNYRIHHYPKPFIALLNGLTMGGGVGISMHGSHPIATERFMFAMPETAIGFFPDVGGSYLLSRCPGESGTYLGLTGTRLNAGDAMEAGLVDYFISSHHLNDAVNALAEAQFSQDDQTNVTTILKSMSLYPEASELTMHREAIDHCFASDSVEEILAALAAYPREWCQQVHQLLSTKSPTSLKVTLRAIREGVNLNFAGCLKMEFRLCQRFMQENDFYTGVRSVLIDKGAQPALWKPTRIEDVTPEQVESYFAPLAENELILDDIEY